MYKTMLIIIMAVFLITMVFGVLIWVQLGKFHQKALAAKRRKEAYIQGLPESDPRKIEALAARAKKAEDDDDSSSWF